LKKILYAILIALTITTVNAKEIYYTNNKGIEMTQEEYNNLKGHGFTDNQIARMNTKTFNKNKDISATIVAQNVNHYIKLTYLQNGIEVQRYEVVTEEEFNGRLINPESSLRSVIGNYYTGLIATDDLAVQTTISNVDDHYMEYRVDVFNFTVPSTRSIDIYGVGIESGKVQIASAIECLQYWEKTNGMNDDNDACYPKSESTGGSAMFELPTGNNIDYIETYVSFRVSKKPNVGTITGLEACGDYAHAISSVSNSVYNYYGVNISGIHIISPYVSSYDQINTPSPATFIGSW
jgi:hypothetical protein